MLAEVLSWYLESLATFWSGMAQVGLLRLVVVGIILWWIFGRKGRCCGGCPRCGCWCGRCRCRDVGDHGDRGGPEGHERPGGGGTEAGAGEAEAGGAG